MEEPSQTPRDQEKIPTLSEERESLISKVLKDLPLVCLADTEELTLYRRGVYVLGGEQKLKGYLERTVQDCSTRKVNDILDSVKRRTYVDREEFDKYPTILNLKNCLYDLENDRALEHDPKHYSFVQLPADLQRRRRLSKDQEIPFRSSLRRGYTTNSRIFWIHPLERVPISKSVNVCRRGLKRKIHPSQSD